MSTIGIQHAGFAVRRGDPHQWRAMPGVVVVNSRATSDVWTFSRSNCAAMSADCDRAGVLARLLICASEIWRPRADVEASRRPGAVRCAPGPRR